MPFDGGPTEPLVRGSDGYTALVAEAAAAYSAGDFQDAYAVAVRVVAAVCQRDESGAPIEVAGRTLIDPKALPLGPEEAILVNIPNIYAIPARKDHGSEQWLKPETS